jgi:ATP-dependent Clp protease protease subunit
VTAQPPGWPPEIPEPAPWREPSQPPVPHRPSVYPPVPVVYENESHPIAEDLRDRLLERRIVLVNGVLDDGSATDIAARLMYLDGTGDEPIDLRYSCRGSALDAAITLADVVELLGVELLATALGTLVGPALLPFAVATRRIAHRHATFRFLEPELEVRGRASDVVAEADRHAQRVAELHRRLGDATGRARDAIDAEFAARRLLSVEEARAFGLVDEVASPRRPRRVP